MQASIQIHQFSLGGENKIDRPLLRWLAGAGEGAKRDERRCRAARLPPGWTRTRAWLHWAVRSEGINNLGLDGFVVCWASQSTFFFLALMGLIYS